MSSPTTAAVPLPKTRNKKSFGDLSQWELIRRRFARHTLAVASLFLLALFYVVALFAEFFAPYPATERDLDHIYAPPQPIKLSLAEGLYTYRFIQEQDPFTFRKIYYVDKEDVIPLGFFVRTDPYKLLGIIPLQHSFFGVRHGSYTPPDQQAQIQKSDVIRPTFHFLGADKYGRDILSRIIFGARISLSVGLVAIAVTFVLGIFFGGISGYIGGAVDSFIQRMIEIINSFPQLPLWLALAAVLPADWSMLKLYFAITIVLSLLGWTDLARVVRGKILSLREEDYAVAARLIGASHKRVLFRHLVPGFTSHIIVVLTLSVPIMILGETALSFLGLGLRPPVVSWGVLLQDCMQMQVVANYPWLLLPVLPIILTVLCFNFLGDGLRDAADPYSSR
jgi:peptide/nickel transport system permease protein